MQTLNEMASMQVIYIALTSIVLPNVRSWAMYPTAVEAWAWAWAWAAWASIIVAKGLNRLGGTEKSKMSIPRAVLLQCVSSTRGLAWPRSRPTHGWRSTPTETTGEVKLGAVEWTMGSSETRLPCQTRP
jgi:hypothetical protein